MFLLYFPRRLFAGVFVVLRTEVGARVAPLCDGKLARRALCGIELVEKASIALGGVISLAVCCSSMRNSCASESISPLSSFPICEKPPPVPSTPTIFLRRVPLLAVPKSDDFALMKGLL